MCTFFERSFSAPRPSARKSIEHMDRKNRPGPNARLPSVLVVDAES
jgi:hypothetical protein